MPERADRTESLFAAVSAVLPADRGVFLEREWAGDPDQTAGYTPTTEQPGTIIAGRYKLLEEIGQGGHGDGLGGGDSRSVAQY